MASEMDLIKVFSADYDKTGFPTALYTTAAHGVMSFSEQIYDLNHNEFQVVINDRVNDLTTKPLMTINGSDVSLGDTIVIESGGTVSELSDDEINDIIDDIFSEDENEE